MFTLKECRYRVRWLKKEFGKEHAIFRVPAGTLAARDPNKTGEYATVEAEERDYFRSRGAIFEGEKGFEQ